MSDYKIDKPRLWERSREAFWDDEHISSEMLKAHLDYDSDGASRKYEFIQKSLEWIYKIIPDNSEVLDLGCGPGLYTKALSSHGYRVTGIDISHRSIAYAKEHDSDTLYLCTDYLNLEYENKFDFITIIYCDYGALTAPERKLFLKNVYRALKPQGKILFDVFTEVYYARIKENQIIKSYLDGGFWAKKSYTLVSQTFKYNEVSAIVDRYQIIMNEKIKEYLIWDTAFTINRISDELKMNGFNIEGLYSDVAGKEYQSDSETMCIIASKR